MIFFFKKVSSKSKTNIQEFNEYRLTQKAINSAELIEKSDLFLAVSISEIFKVLKSQISANLAPYSIVKHKQSLL